MVDSLAIEAAKAMTKVVGAKAWEEISLAWGFQSHLTTLNDKFMDTQAFLEDVGNSNHSHNSLLVNRWLRKVEDAAYFADNVMDDYAYELLRRKYELSSFLTKVRDFVSCSSSNPVVFRLRITREVVEILSKLEELDKQAKRIGLQQVRLVTSESVLSSRYYNDQENYYYSSLYQVRKYAAANAFEFVGRKDDEKKLLQLICHANGLGKTTLARRLYHHEQVDRHFGKNKVWICVSEDFNIVRIFKIMLESLSYNYGLSDNGAITNKLQEKLKGEKFLLILDNVWERNKGLWDSLRNELQKIGDPSKTVILITTRIIEVAKKAGGVHIHSLKGLSEDDEEEVDIIDKIKWYKMHDLVHDLASVVSEKNLFVWKVNSELKEVDNVRHFVINDKEDKTIPEFPAVVDIRNLRTINFWGGVPRWDSIVCARYMRVLIVANIGLRDIPDDIEQLIHLRYLDLSYNKISTLPESICKLYQIETIRIEGNLSLKELPRQLYKLGNLRHIENGITDFFGKVNYLLASRGLRLLTNLQSLPALKLYDGDEGWNIDELEALNEIKGTLCISGLENVKNKEEGRKASLGRKDEILELLLQWSTSREESNNNVIMNIDEDVLGSLEPPPNIQSLMVEGFMGVEFPRWIKTMVVKHTIPLTKLIKVALVDFEKCEQLPTLGQLPLLKYLRLERFKKVESIGNEFYNERSNTATTDNHINIGIASEKQVLFKALTELYIKKFENLITWMPKTSTNAFPSLEILDIRKCPKLERVPALHFQSLNQLVLKKFGGAQPLDIIKYSYHTLKSINVYGNSKIRSLPKELLKCSNLEKLRVTDCDNLKSLPNGEMMTSLKELDIRYCRKLGSIPTSIGKCTSLEFLEIVHCPSVTDVVPELITLQKLRRLELIDLGELMKLTMAQSIPQLHRLRDLSIGGFKDEEEIITFVSQIELAHSPSLSLRRLDIKKCPKVKNLPQQLKQLLPSSTLQSLRIENFGELEALPEWIGDLSALQKIELRNCKELKKLPSKEAMLRLFRIQMLDVKECPLLKERCDKQNNNAPDSQWPNIEHLPLIMFDGVTIQDMRR
ncbi:putative disease resistance protein RGA3 [Bienertia sinuspersici]